MDGYGTGREWPPASTWSAAGPQIPWNYAPPPPPGRPRPAAVLAAAVVIVVWLGTGLLAWVGIGHLAAASGAAAGRGGQNTGQPVNGGGQLGSPGSPATPASVGAVAAKVDPAVVAITSIFGYQQGAGAGTGIVLTARGEVLTNNHVINGATRIAATDAATGQTYPATVIGYDTGHDLALLQLQGASQLSTATLGDASTLQVGQSVVAIGNAGGTGAMTNAPGSITALGQNIVATDRVSGQSERLSGLIEVNAAVQPGDSGGPLADASGRVIGVDVAASAGMPLPNEGGGQGFAIPISRALTLVHQVESAQASATVHLGPTAFLGVLPAGRQGQQNTGPPA